MIADRPFYGDAEGCPVSLDMLGRVYRAGAGDLPALIGAIPERTRARLAAYLYGRSHTHELGLTVAAACTQAALWKAEGLLGEAIYAQSRQSYARPTHGEPRSSAVKKVSLAGSRMTGDLCA